VEINLWKNSVALDVVKSETNANKKESTFPVRPQKGIKNGFYNDDAKTEKYYLKERSFDNRATSFFERLHRSAKIELDVLRNHAVSQRHRCVSGYDQKVSRAREGERSVYQLEHDV